jgi:hypothetical protein
MGAPGQSSTEDPEPGPPQSEAIPPPLALVLPTLHLPPHLPEMLKLGGPEAIDRYREAFARVFLRGDPIVDPLGCTIFFDGDACEHICLREERLDKRRKRAEGEDRTRDEWDQVRAEHILWLLPALTAPSLIVGNNQVRGNLAYLLGFPTGNNNRPNYRYYASVRPLNEQMTRAVFKTAYPINQQQWDDARRDHRRWYGRGHVLYQCKTPRW